MCSNSGNFCFQHNCEATSVPRPIHIQTHVSLYRLAGTRPDSKISKTSKIMPLWGDVESKWEPLRRHRYYRMGAGPNCAGWYTWFDLIFGLYRLNFSSFVPVQDNLTCTACTGKSQIWEKFKIFYYRFSSRLRSIHRLSILSPFIQPSHFTSI